MQRREFINRVLFRLQGRVIHLKPKGAVKGRVLFSYVTLPFLRPEPWNSHTNSWEGREMAMAFLERGYAVDVIDSTNQVFTPKGRYAFFIDNNINMERLAPLLNPDCIKILHITNAHPHFQNEAAQKRADDLKKRKGVSLQPDRPVPETKAIEIADEATALGNAFTIGTYTYAGKPITRMPISTTHQYESPLHKDFDAIRNSFVWIGGAGLLHKGLDLILEAFAGMPGYHLTICGKVQPTDHLAQIYARELYNIPNITTLGQIDMGSDTFKKICNDSLGVISASCSEGGGGSVVLGMHAGLIPVVNVETSVDIGDFGIELKESTVDEIQRAVKRLSAEPKEELERRAISAWNFARAHHTRELFASNYRAFVDTLLVKYKK